jgi:broad specificity phosphatase PhoE
VSERTIVHLLRHGEVHNPGKVLYGRLPGFRLSTTGEAMAAAAAEWFVGKDVTHNWWKLRNPFQPSWGEPYVEIAARMLAAVEAARDAARGHEAVLVSHQLPIWTVRLHLEGRRYLHDPRRRECALASVTSLTYDGDRFVRLGYAEPAGATDPDAVPGA